MSGEKKKERPSLNTPKSPGFSNSQSPQSSKQNANKCGKCGKAPKADSRVECFSCKKPYHSSCSGLEPASVRVIKATSNLHWYCKTCDGLVIDVLANIRTFKEVAEHIREYKEEIDKRINDLEDSANTMIGEISTEVQDKCDEVEKRFQTRTRELQSSLEQMDQRNHQLQRRIEELEARPAAATTANETNPVSPEVVGQIKQELRKHKLSSERQEQWSRRNMIRIRGTIESLGEDTSHLVHTICSDIGVNLRPGDISTAHRIGKRSANHRRDLLVWFTHRDTKYRVMRARNKLRNIPRARGVFIDEELTQIRSRVVKELRHEGWTVQTHDGKISAQKDGEEDLWVDHPQDFQKLPWNDAKLTEMGIIPDF